MRFQAQIQLKNLHLAVCLPSDGCSFETSANGHAREVSSRKSRAELIEAWLKAERVCATVLRGYIEGFHRSAVREIPMHKMNSALLLASVI